MVAKLQFYPSWHQNVLNVTELLSKDGIENMHQGSWKSRSIV